MSKRVVAPSPAQTMAERLAGAALVVDLGALRDNYRALAVRAKGAECAAVVKANAYGLGIERVAPVLAGAGCGTFFVAHPLEGVKLREVLPDARIFILNGLPPGAEADFVAHALTPVLNSLEEIDAWAAHSRAHGRPLPAAVHLDTGMTRLGLMDADVQRLAGDPARLDGIDLALVMTHAACADDPEDPLNERQRLAFERMRAALPHVPAAFANSSSIFLGDAYHFDLVRAGVALYGVNPTPGAENPMREVIRLRGRIIQVHEIDAGRTVGYGGSYRAEGPRRIATIPVGYADGYLRSLSNRGYGAVAGRRAPLVGRVSMDLITLDVTDLPGETARPGTYVDLIGGGISIDEAAAWAGTIGYELLTSLGNRYNRVYMEPES